MKSKKIKKSILTTALLFMLTVSNIGCTTPLVAAASQSNSINTNADSVDVVTTTEDIKTSEETIVIDSVEELIDEMNVLGAPNKEEDFSDYANKRLFVINNDEELPECNASSIIKYENNYILTFESARETKQAYTALKDKGLIVEIDKVLTTETTSDDPEMELVEDEFIENISDKTPEQISEFTALMRERNNNYGKNMDNSQQPIKIAVLDTGYAPEGGHNVVYTGYNFTGEGSSDDSSDTNGHGTTVADAIINSMTFENYRILPIKIMNSEGKGSILSLYMGIEEAIENEVEVINLSLSAKGQSPLIEAEIEKAIENGITVVAAAGNDGTLAKDYIPANLPRALVVGAVDNHNKIEDYSNYGDEIDVVANGIFKEHRGTSIATARVSAYVAYLYNEQKFIANPSIAFMNYVKYFAKDLGKEGWDEKYGYGLLNTDKDTSDMEIVPYANDIEKYVSDKSEEDISVLGGFTAANTNVFRAVLFSASHGNAYFDKSHETGSETRDCKAPYHVYVQENQGGKFSTASAGYPDVQLSKIIDRTANYPITHFHNSDGAKNACAGGAACKGTTSTYPNVDIFGLDTNKYTGVWVNTVSGTTHQPGVTLKLTYGTVDNDSTLGNSIPGAASKETYKTNKATATKAFLGQKYLTVVRAIADDNDTPTSLKLEYHMSLYATQVNEGVTCIHRYYTDDALTNLQSSSTDPTVKLYAIGATADGANWSPITAVSGAVLKRNTTCVVQAGANYVYKDYVLQGSVVFKPNGDRTNPTTDTTKTGTPGTAVTTPTYTRSSDFGDKTWKLNGWSTTSGANNASGKVTSIVFPTGGQTSTYYAVWNPTLKVLGTNVEDNKVTIDGVEESVKPSGFTSDYEYNKSVSLSATFPSGYHFETIENDGSEVTSPVLPYAVAMDNCHTVNIIGSNNPADLTKKVFKHGTTTDIDDCIVKEDNELDYELNIENKTTVNRDYIVTDVLDEGLDFVSADNNGSYDSTTRTIKWEISGLEPNKPKNLKYVVNVNDKKVGGEVKNFARYVEKAIPELGETEDVSGSSNETYNYVIPQPEKHLRKTESDTTDIDNTVVIEGDEDVYTIKITNPSPNTTKFDITDTIPKGLTPVSASDSGVITGQKVTWTDISIGGGSSKTVYVKVKVTDEALGETIVNKATVNVKDDNEVSIDSNEVENYTMFPPTKSAYLTLNEDGTTNTTMEDIDTQIINDGVLVTYHIDWKNPTSGKRVVILKDKVPEFARIATDADILLSKDRVELAKTYLPTTTSYLISDNGTYDETTQTVKWEIESDSTSTKKDNGYVTFSVVILDKAQNNIVENTAQMTLQSPSGLNENNPTLDSNTITNPVLKTPDKIALRADGEDVTDLVVNDGEEITYKITFENPAKVNKIFTVTDIVPEFTTLKEGSISDGGTYDAAENLITWDNMILTPGEVKEVSFTVTVDESAQNMTVNNTARVYADKADKWSRDEQPTPVYVLEDPKKAVLNIDGEDIDGVVKREGDIISYHIVYKNPANNERTATITDKLPANTQFITAGNQGSYNVETGEFVKTTGNVTYSYDEATHTITWTAPTAGKCQECMVVDVRIMPEAKDTILKNQASVYIPNATKNTNIVRTPVAPNPKKVATDKKGQELNKNLVTLGEEIDYSISIKNPADEAKKGTILDSLPEGVDFISADNGGEYDAANHTVRWSDIPLSAGEELTVKVTVKVNEKAKSQTIHNEAVYRIDEAVVTTELDDGGEGGPTSYVSTKYVLNKKGEDIDGSVVTEGNTIAYKISYKNLADYEKYMTIYDVLPEGLEILEIGDNGFKVTYPIEHMDNYPLIKERTVAWQMFVGPLEEGYVTVTCKVTDGAKNDLLENGATILFDSQDPAKTPQYFYKDTNIVRNPVIPKPVKTVWNEAAVEITDKMVTTGDVITYKITYKNPADEVKMAKIVDTLPAEVKFVSCDYAGTYDETTHTVTWDEIETQPHKKLTVSVTVKVKDNAGGKLIRNRGTIIMDQAVISTYAKTPESDPKNPKASNKEWTENYVAVKKSYDANGKDTTGEIVKVGDALTYRISFKNTSSIEKEYTVKDSLPDEVDYVSSTGNATVVDNKHLTWTTKLSGGEECFYDITVKVNKKGLGKKIENRAVISEKIPDSTEPPYEIITSSCNNYVLDDFVKTVSNKKGKDIDGCVIQNGNTIYYTIKIHNPSENRETFTVTDALADELTYVSCTEGGTYDKSKKIVTWTFELDGNADAELILVVKVKKSADGAVVKNIAHVVTDGTEADSNEVTNYLLDEPLKEQKNGAKNIPNGGKVTAGTNVTYVIHYSNPTDTDREITITDVLDASIKDYVLDISDDGQLNNGIITWNIECAAGGEGEVSFMVELPSLNGVTVKNKADVSLDNEGMPGDTDLTTNTVELVIIPDDKDIPDTPEIVKTGDGKTLSSVVNKVTEK